MVSVPSAGVALRVVSVPIAGINQIGSIENLRFRDNTALLLEATWPAEPQSEKERH